MHNNNNTNIIIAFFNNFYRYDITKLHSLHSFPYSFELGPREIDALMCLCVCVLAGEPVVWEWSVSVGLSGCRQMSDTGRCRSSAAGHRAVHEFSQRAAAQSPQRPQQPVWDRPLRVGQGTNEAEYIFYTVKSKCLFLLIN